MHKTCDVRLNPTLNHAGKAARPDLHFFHPSVLLSLTYGCASALWVDKDRGRNNLLPKFSLPKHDTLVGREPEGAALRKFQLAKQNASMIQHVLPDHPLRDGVFAFTEVRQDQ